MLRKIVVLLFVLCVANVCFATEYVGKQSPKHLYDDEDYIICDWRMGTAWYVDKTSIVVEEDTGNERVLSVEVVEAAYADHHNMQPYEVDEVLRTEAENYLFLYNLDEKKMYIAYGQNKDHFVYIDRDGIPWRYIDPHGCWADVGIVKYAAIEAYRSMYGEKFN